jgi:hypothetical protein
MAVPDSSPRASLGVFIRIPQMLTLADGTFSPRLLVLFRGAALADPRVWPPKPCRSVGAPARVFTQDPSACGVLVSAGIGNIPTGLGGATRTYLASSAFGAP